MAWGDLSDNEGFFPYIYCIVCQTERVAAYNSICNSCSPTRCAKCYKKMSSKGFLSKTIKGKVVNVICRTCLLKEKEIREDKEDSYVQKDYCAKCGKMEWIGDEGLCAICEVKDVGETYQEAVCNACGQIFLPFESYDNLYCSKCTDKVDEGKCTDCDSPVEDSFYSIRCNSCEEIRIYNQKFGVC